MSAANDYEEYGLTEDQFKKLLVIHTRNDAGKPRGKPCANLPFVYWEAAALKRILDALEDDEEARALIATMMDVCQHFALQKRIEKAMYLVY